MLHKARDLLVRQRTTLSNALRGHLAEFGIVEAKGEHRIAHLTGAVERETCIPLVARAALRAIVGQLRAIGEVIEAVEAALLAWHRSSELSRRLATIPSIGPVTATVLAATVPGPGAFRSGRDFAAWLGMVPRQHSTGRNGRSSHRAREA